MIIELLKSPSGPIPASKMLIGQVGICPEVCNHLLLRAYDQVIDLNEPSRTWGNNCGVYVQVLPAGTELKITL